MAGSCLGRLPASDSPLIVSLTPRGLTRHSISRLQVTRRASLGRRMKPCRASMSDYDIGVSFLEFQQQSSAFLTMLGQDGPMAIPGLPWPTIMGVLNPSIPQQCLQQQLEPFQCLLGGCQDVLLAFQLLPSGVDPWNPSIDSQNIATSIFSFSLFPYLGFLYYMTRSGTTPRITLIGFYFLLVFVGATSE